MDLSGKVVNSEEEKAGEKFSNTQSNDKKVPDYKTASDGMIDSDTNSWHKNILTADPSSSVNEG